MVRAGPFWASEEVEKTSRAWLSHAFWMEQKMNILIWSVVLVWFGD
jgi:hypothetical protein